jgi:uncharacterized protein
MPNKQFTPIFIKERNKLAAKVEKHADTVEVTYDKERWTLLREYRQKALQIIEAMESRHLHSVVHGSIARGDVTKRSDIDVFLPDLPSTFQVETALEAAKIPIIARRVIQATPTYAMKAYLEIDEATTVSFPLMGLRKVEREFYRFGGELTQTQLKKDVRVCGVDKRLMLIEPTETGHIESSILGCEEQTAGVLGISAETVKDRVRALMKRDAVGRTGVFLKRELAPNETFEMALERLAKENPAVRRKLRSAA